MIRVNFYFLFSHPVPRQLVNCRILFTILFTILKTYDFERRLCAKNQDLQIFKKCQMSQMNPKEFAHNTPY